MASPKLPVGPWLNWIESTFLWKAEGWEVRLQDFTMLEVEGNLFNILGMLPKLLLLFLFYKGWYNTSLGELFLVPLEEPEENFIYLFIHFFFNPGDWTQDIIHAKHVLHHWATPKTLEGNLDINFTSFRLQKQKKYVS